MHPAHSKVGFLSSRGAEARERTLELERAGEQGSRHSAPATPGQLPIPASHLPEALHQCVLIFRGAQPIRPALSLSREVGATSPHFTDKKTRVGETARERMSGSFLIVFPPPALSASTVSKSLTASVLCRL